MGSSGSHNFHKPYQPRVYGNRFCMKKTLIRGELHVCNEPTEGGKTHCERCERRLVLLRRARGAWRFRNSACLSILLRAAKTTTTTTCAADLSGMTSGDPFGGGPPTGFCFPSRPMSQC